MDCCLRPLKNGDAIAVGRKIPGIFRVGRQVGVKTSEFAAATLQRIESSEDKLLTILRALNHSTQRCRRGHNGTNAMSAAQWLRPAPGLLPLFARAPPPNCVEDPAAIGAHVRNRRIEFSALSENLERPNKRASFREEAVRLDSGECTTTNSRKS